MVLLEKSKGDKVLASFGNGNLKKCKLAVMNPFFNCQNCCHELNEKLWHVNICIAL